MIVEWMETGHISQEEMTSSEVNNLLEAAEYFLLYDLCHYTDIKFNRPELTRDIVKYLLDRDPSALDFSSCRLFGINLGSMDFSSKNRQRRVTFENSDLRNTVFMESSLIGVNFSNTCLNGAVFQRAHLEEVIPLFFFFNCF